MSALALLIPLQLMPPATLTATEDSRLERRFWLMGTLLTVTLAGSERQELLAASESVLAAVEQTESLLSTWSPETPLSQLNALPAGVAMAVPNPLAHLLEQARACWLATDGGFDPGVGRLMVPSPAGGLVGGEGLGPGPFLDELERLADGRYRRRSADVRIDAGGFGKGAALDLALEVLAREPGVERALLDFGGQIALYRRSLPATDHEGPAAGLWEIDVGDPRHRRRAVLRLRLKAADWGSGSSVATSGTGERGRHIYDPRSGRQAADFGSLTVIAPSAFWADCLSTGLYVLGPRAALALARERQPLEVVVLAADGERLVATVSPGLRGRVAALVDDLEVSVYGGD